MTIPLALQDAARKQWAREGSPESTRAVELSRLYQLANQLTETATSLRDQAERIQRAGDAALDQFNQAMGTDVVFGCEFDPEPPIASIVDTFDINSPRDLAWYSPETSDEAAGQFTALRQVVEWTRDRMCAVLEEDNARSLDYETIACAVLDEVEPRLREFSVYGASDTASRDALYGIVLEFLREQAI